MWSSFLNNFFALNVPFTFVTVNTWLILPRLFILVFIYIPNLVFVVVICVSPSLRYPRNLFWCAVCCSDLIVAFLFTTEIILSMTGSTSEFWCLVLVVLYPTPYSLLLSNVVLASWDRQMAIQHPIWHRRKLTISRVILIILASNFVAFILSLAPYWTKLVPLTCEFYMFHVELTCVFYLVMICVCIMFHVKVFMAARKAIRKPNVRLRHKRPLEQPYPLAKTHDRNVGPPVDSGLQPLSYPTPVFNPTMVADETTHRQLTQNPYQIEMESDGPNWTCLSISDPVYRIEIKAAVTITLGLIPLWIFSLPMVVTSFLLAFCLQWNAAECAQIHFAYAFVREIYLIHGIYNPLVFMYRSPDFRVALKRLWRKCYGYHQKKLAHVHFLGTPPEMML